MAQRLLTMAYVLVIAALLPWLWRFWTPLCNEACAPWLLRAMYATLLILEVLVIALVVMAAARSWTVGRMLAAGLSLAGVALPWIALLSYSAHRQ